VTKSGWLVGVLLLANVAAFAQKNEVAFLAGTSFTSSRSFSVALPVVPCPVGGPCNGQGALSFGHNVTVEGTYARRFFNAGVLNLKFEAPIVAATSISVRTSNTVVVPPRNYSAFYFTPGLRLTAFSLAGFSPWLSIGGGLARFGPNQRLLDGTLNPDGNANLTGALQFGGGVDVKFFPHLALRGQVRDFYTGVPHLNTAAISDRAHNVLVSGGVVFHF